ncbi:MAG: hypothetical protein R2698_11415 [Microthrixaceae bacterium]
MGLHPGGGARTFLGVFATERDDDGNLVGFTGWLLQDSDPAPLDEIASRLAPPGAATPP